MNTSTNRTVITQVIELGRASNGYREYGFKYCTEDGHVLTQGGMNYFAAQDKRNEIIREKGQARVRVIAPIGQKEPNNGSLYFRKYHI